MRIANHLGINKNGWYPFSEESINNLPDIKAFTNDGVNKAILEGCKNVLYRSMKYSNKYRYGEMGLLISVGHLIFNNDNRLRIYELFNGEYNRVNTSIKYYNIINNRGTKDLIFIHNHPNNSSFSGGDIMRLTEVNNLRAIVAVGNRHNLYILIDDKKNKTALNYIKQYVVYRTTETGVKDDFKYENEAAKIILSNPSRYGLIYIKYRRKSYETE